jgi:hypothetical protein
MLIALIINFSKEIKELKKYLKKTKLDKYQNLIVSIIIIFVCVNLFYSNLFNSNEELFNLKKEKKEIIILSKYLDELHQKNESNHIVLTPVEYSNIIKYYSNLNIVLSKNELLNSKKQKYITDYDEMLQYDSNYKLKIFKEYNAKYAIVKKEISKGFNSRCFLPISETENFRLIENVC